MGKTLFPGWKKVFCQYLKYIKKILESTVSLPCPNCSISRSDIDPPPTTERFPSAPVISNIPSPPPYLSYPPPSTQISPDLPSPTHSVSCQKNILRRRRKESILYMRGEKEGGGGEVLMQQAMCSRAHESIPPSLPPPPPPLGQDDEKERGGGGDPPFSLFFLLPPVFANIKAPGRKMRSTGLHLHRRSNADGIKEKHEKESGLS